MRGSYCCNLCGDMAPTKLAIEAHLTKHWRNVGDHRPNVQKQCGKSDRSKVQTKHSRKAKVTRKDTICRKSKGSKPKKSGEAKAAEKKNAVANDETVETLKPKTAERTTHGTRVLSEEIGDNQTNNEEDDKDNRPDSPVYLFPSAKRAKSASSSKEEQVKKPHI
ncbi:uncharacterized protein LOC110844366 [Folsomia candida]|uniref:uncharacterized protein LOC110844366 n=1 Tax=Folsomia candida TaxID=158441 RepID=UPI000B8F082D|nr:uncharacterized protein LOC110844366 [Folsomia candida]